MATPYLRAFVRYRQPEVNEVFIAARQAYRYATEFFDQNTRSIQYRKVLGFGSSGVVALFSELNRAGQRIRDLAVKAPVDENDPYFRVEIQWMTETFNTAEHFVQPIYFDEDLDSSLYNDPYEENDSAALLVMEYFERCELMELLVRLNETVRDNLTVPDKEKKLEFIPSRVLWRLFLCLAKACVGMAYPPPQYHDMPDTYREVIIPEDEPRSIIHFDLHPYNVFMDNPYDTIGDGPEHGYVPRFKLGDLGLMTEWDDGWEDDVKFAQTNVGKPGYQAPEQRNRLKAVQPGAFGPHTNVWGAGLLMFNALTLYFTEDEQWQPQICRITMPDGTARDINTWAPFLVGHQVYDEFKAYPIELRTLIARCMADDAEDRPSLEELLDTINQNIAQGDERANEAQRNWEEQKRLDPTKEKPAVDVKTPPAVEDNDLLVRFFREYFRELPVREDPYKDLWDGDD